MSMYAQAEAKAAYVSETVEADVAPPTIPDALDRLMMRLESVNKAAEGLSGRLAPILRQTDGVNAVPSDSGTSTRAPLHELIERAIDLVNRCENTLVDLHGRVAL